MSPAQGPTNSGSSTESSILMGIPGFPGYAAASLGLVLKSHTGLALKTFELRTGKPGIGMVSQGKRVTIPLAVVVMDAFEESVSHHSRFIEHLDGDVNNCRLDNLRYSAFSEAPGERDIELDETVVLDSICEPGEVWADIPSSDGYLVSNHGRIRRTGSAKVRTPGTGINGFLSVIIRGKNVYLHRAVAELFVPKESPEDTCVNHRDGDLSNNHASNLLWCTYSYSANQRTPEKTQRKMHTRISKATKKYALKDMPGKYSRSLCLNLTEELHNELVVISEAIDQPLTAIFRHSIIEFVENYRARNVAPLRSWDIADTVDEDGEE